MKPTEAQTKLIKQVQDTILKAEDASYKGRAQSAGETGAELTAIIYKYFGDEIQARYLLSPAPLATRVRLTAQLLKIGYKMDIRTKADATLAEIILCIYRQTIHDHTQLEETIEHLKIELEELTGTRPTDSEEYNYNTRQEQMKEQGLVISTALFSVLKNGAIRGETTGDISIVIEETYKRRSQAAYKRTLYTSDTYYQNTALCPGITPKTAPNPTATPTTGNGTATTQNAENGAKTGGNGADGANNATTDKTGRSYMYVTARDKFVCEACDALDGNVYKYEDAIRGINFPPLHPNCRCVAIEVKEGDANG